MAHLAGHRDWLLLASGSRHYKIYFRVQDFQNDNYQTLGLYPVDGADGADLTGSYGLRQLYQAQQCFEAVQNGAIPGMKDLAAANSAMTGSSRAAFRPLVASASLLLPVRRSICCGPYQFR
ncbi:hypothetical protein [Paraburkholderia sp. 40]|uniref:hypothetical protein n=1 Tax=Paraburkholderia sp. 40 TaxID=2991059 RepID=UPI003D259350